MVFANCMTVIAFTVRGTQCSTGSRAEIHPPRLWGTPPISRLQHCARTSVPVPSMGYLEWDLRTRTGTLLED